MHEVISSNDQLILKINEVLQAKNNRSINIINDKLTLSVFGELSKKPAECRSNQLYNP
jgi:hypothetical protein